MTYNQQMIANYFSIQPSEVKGVLNTETAYYEWALWWLVYFKYKLKIPKHIPLNFFRFLLFHWGSVGLIYTNKFGWVAGDYGINEIDLYYQPRQLSFSNPFFDDIKIGIVGINSCIIKIFDDFSGFKPFIVRTAEKMAACDKAMNVNLMTVSMGKLLGAPNKKISSTLKDALDDLTIGNPYVVINSEDLASINVNNMVSELGSAFVSDKLQELKRSYFNEFLSLIGINNANLNKRERLVTDEVNANNVEIQAIPTLVAEDNLKPCLEFATRLTGEEYSVELRGDAEVLAKAEELLGGDIVG